MVTLNLIAPGIDKIYTFDEMLMENGVYTTTEHTEGTAFIVIHNELKLFVSPSHANRITKLGDKDTWNTFHFKKSDYKLNLIFENK